MTPEEFLPAIHAVKRAIIDWSGADHAGAVELCAYLESALAPAAGDAAAAASSGYRAADGDPADASWRKVPLPEDEKEEKENENDADDKEKQKAVDSNGSSGGGMYNAPEKPPPVLRALHAVAVTLRRQQLAAQFGEPLRPLLLEGEQAPGSSEGGSSGQLLPAEVAEELRAALALTPDGVSLARAVQSEVQATMRLGLKPNTVIVTPVIPYKPPRVGAPARDVKQFGHLASVFCCLPSLGHLPCVTVPVGQLSDGTPLAVSIMAPARSDLQLLAVACKLGPSIQRAFAGMVASLRASALRGAREGAAEAAAKAKAGSAATGQQQATANGTSSSGGKGGSRGAAAAAAGTAAAAGPSGAAAAAAPPIVPPKKVESAERHKERGNEMIRGKRYSDAYACYSKAIADNPHVPAYYNNRAQAAIMQHMFAQAEEDCSKVLAPGGFPGVALDDGMRVKALLRRGTARQAQEKLDEAEKDYVAALRLEPNNRQAREDLAAVRQQKKALAEAQAGMMAAAAGLAAPGGAAGAYGGLVPPGMMGATGDDGGGLDPAEVMSYLMSQQGANGMTPEQLMAAAAAAGVPLDGLVNGFGANGGAE